MAFPLCSPGMHNCCSNLSSPILVCHGIWKHFPSSIQNCTPTLDQFVHVFFCPLEPVLSLSSIQVQTNMFLHLFPCHLFKNTICPFQKKPWIIKEYVDATGLTQQPKFVASSMLPNRFLESNSKLHSWSKHLKAKLKSISSINSAILQRFLASRP